MADKPQRPKLTVIEGGLTIKAKEEKEFLKRYYKQVFESTKHLFEKEEDEEHL